MRKISYVLALVFSFMLLLPGAGFADDTEKAAALWSAFQDAKYQETWPMWPGKEAFYTGTHPHGALLTTYTNTVAADALKAGVKEMPEGTVIIKENYMPDKTLGAITVMEKTGEGRGEWFWAKYMPDGTVAQKEVEIDGKKMMVNLAGSPKGCIACHTASTGGINDIMTSLPK